MEEIDKGLVFIFLILLEALSNVCWVHEVSCPSVPAHDIG